MTEPTRFLDDVNAPEEARALLRTLSAPEPASAEKQAQLARHLASLASPAAVVTAGTALWVKAALLLGVFGVAGAWATVKFRAPGPAPSGLASVPSAVISAPVAEPPSITPMDPAPAPAEAASLAASAAHAKRPARDTLADEEALLEQARRAVTSSPSQALGLLQQYQRRFPGGQLNAERMFLSVDVLTRLGNTVAARKQADALIRAYPTSVYAAQLKGRSSAPGK